MENPEEIYDEEFLDLDQGQVEAMEVLEEEEEEEEEENIRELEEAKPPIHTSFRAKLVEILKNLHSAELKIYSEASKEFIGLLEGDSGGDILREYIQLSPKCSEILESWRLHQGKPGLYHILSLLSVIFDHPVAKSHPGGIIIKIHKLACSILEEKLDDIYVELNSQEHRRQNAALSLLASIVKLGVGLASEVAKEFNFKLPVLSKLSGIQKKKGGGKESKEGKRRSSTRRAFIRFAMSFLEAGNPRLLRWILQQREMYSAVFRGLSGDDLEIVMHVLSTLRDKVLIEGSLIPPGLRSVIFGSITLEQLSNISGNPMAGPAADLAHEVLVMVCIDPRNGLMPNTNLKGNEKRLLELMKKLKATEAAYHKELLLGIVRRRPSLFAAYMDEFPYNLKPRASSLWYCSVSLAADMISSINFDTVAVSLTSHSLVGRARDNPELRNILKCIIPHPFTRSFISTGLQHADDLVKHGTLRIVLESLKSLSSLMMAIDSMAESTTGKHIDTFGEGFAFMHGQPGVNCFVELDKCLAVGRISCPSADELGTQKSISLKQLIQDEVRAMLPEPQVLLKLLSSSAQKHSKHSRSGVKRGADLPEVCFKKMKPNDPSEDIDIIISGINIEHSNDTPEDWDKLKAENSMQELDAQKDDRTVIAEIWGLSGQTMISNEPNSAENFFQSKLLDAFKFYLRTVPLAIEGSFDFFKILPADPSSLSTYQLESLLSLLLECIQQAPGGTITARALKFMYKHLQRIINILISSHVKGIQEQAYVLARAAMISTGAFEQNFSEVDAWLFSLTGYCMKSYTADSKGAGTTHDLPVVISSFLSDAVSTIGNNLFKYLDQMRELISRLENVNDDSPGFSPLIICVLEKCLRLLESESRTLKLYEKSMISLYVCNTISLILQTQVDARTLSGLVHFILTEKFNECPTEDMDSKSDFCEWRPVKNLLCFARDVFNQDSCSLFPSSKTSNKQYDGFFSLVLVKIKELLQGESDVGLTGISVAFSSSILCAAPDGMLANFSLLLGLMKQHFRSYLPFLSWILFLERSFLANAVDLEPEMFTSGLKMIEGLIKNYRGDNHQFLSTNEVLQSRVLENLQDSTEPASFAALFLYHAPFYALFSAVMNIGNVKSNSSGKLDILHSNTMLNLLQVKLSEGFLEDSISYLRIVLFWTNRTMSSFRTHQMMSSCGTSTSHILGELFQMCITLVRYLLDHILVVIADTTAGLKTSGTPSATRYVQDIIDLIFRHPIMTFSLSPPLCFSSMGNNVQDIMTSSEKFHPFDRNIFQLLRIVFGFVFSVGKLCNYSSGNHDFSPGLVLSAPRNLLGDFMEKFKLSVLKRDIELLLPRFHILHVLMQFVSPFELLEVVDWMYCQLEDSISGSTPSFVSTAFSVGLYIMDGALGMMFSYLQQPRMDSVFNWFWDRKSRSFDVSILLNLYHKTLEFAICFNHQCADRCLLKFVTAAYNQKFAKPHPDMLPLHAQLSRMITNSPMKMLVYCFYPSSMIKWKILLKLIEVSPMHMNLFGKIFLRILNNDFSDLVLLDKVGALSAKSNTTNDHNKLAFSNDDFVLLLPAALSYLMSIIHTYGQHEPEPLGIITEFYSSMLLDGFSNWKDYVSRDIFQEDHDESPLTSLEDFHKFCSSTLLGKAITILRYSFMVSGSRVKDEQLLGILDFIYSDTSLFDPHVLGLINLGLCSYKESLKVVDVVAAKVSFTRLILFPPGCLTRSLVMQTNGESKGKWTERESNIMDTAKRFLGILVGALDDIVRKIPLRVDGSDASCNTDPYPVFRFLEHYILSNIVQLSVDIQNYLRELPSIQFLDQLIRSSFLHRFEDPFTLRAIRCILVALSEARFSSTDVLAQLFRDPKFVPTIVRSCTYSDSSAFIPCGTLLQQHPSILKSLDISFTDQIAMDSRDTSDMSSELQSSHYSLDEIKLEVVKLLRILYHLKGCQKNCGPTNVKDINSRELLSLLLSGYSATTSEIDSEIFHLMHEIQTIEGSDCGSVADMDYLWGAAAMKLRNELPLDGLVSSNMEADSEMIKERRKMFFRENIPVDLKLSIMTVLHFCSDKSSGTAPMSLKTLLEEKFLDNSERISSTDINVVQRYEPAFILRFSNHCIAMGYLEPPEFCRLGLLAISFVSISSPDEELRRLGYKCLGKFKEVLEAYIVRGALAVLPIHELFSPLNASTGLRELFSPLLTHLRLQYCADSAGSALKNYPKRKDTDPLRLLLSNIQNAITVEWQRIPSVIAVFAAEASLILLDPSQNHFLTLCEFLRHSKKMNMKMIPLFPKLFISGSIHFKTDRLWILSQLYAGLNSDIDAKIYVKQEFLKLLLSFCASSLADHESKFLILQILKKCVKLPTIALRLIKKHGLISWLSSILLFYGERLDGDHKEFSLALIELVLKVLSDGISSGMVSECLQTCALEQLSDLSSHLYMLAVSSLKLLKGNMSLVNSLLSVIVSTLKISQDRELKISHDKKIYQPHFSLSLVGLFQLFQAVDVELSSLESSSISENGLNIILMSAPLPAVTHMDKARLSKLLTLAVPAALQPFSMQRSAGSYPDPSLLMSFREHQGEESLVSKLLLWVSASVILGSITNKSSKIYKFYSISKSEIETLQPLLEAIIKRECESGEEYSSSNEALAILVLYLQQLLGRSCSFLPSVILALCLLLLGNSSNTPGRTALDGISDAIASHCSKIYCPPEVNPDWRWSYNKPWSRGDEERSPARTVSERLEEEQACQSILLMFSNALGGKLSGSSVLSYKDVESSGLYKWERDTFIGSKTQ